MGDEAPLVGTWRLVSYEARDDDGPVAGRFGPDVVGFLTYTSDGYVSAHFGRGTRTGVDNGDWVAASDQAIAAAARDFVSYCGRYIPFLATRCGTSSI